MDDRRAAKTDGGVHAVAFPEALRESVRQKQNATLIYQVLRGDRERRMSPKSLQGPIGIARASGAAAREAPRVLG